MENLRSKHSMEKHKTKYDHKTISEVKTLINDGAIFEDIASRFNLSLESINRIDQGSTYTQVKPKTEKQKTLEIEDKKRREANHASGQKYIDQYIKDKIAIGGGWIQFPIENKEGFDWFVQTINDMGPEAYNQKFVISFDVRDDNDRSKVIELLVKRRNEIELQLSKLKLEINAIETNDYTDLPPSSMKKLEHLVEQFRIEKSDEKQA